jgi:hypothetical protein
MRGYNVAVLLRIERNVDMYNYRVGRREGCGKLVMKCSELTL